MGCDWADNVQLGRSGNIVDSSSASVVAVGPKPPVTKEVAPDIVGTPGTYGNSINARVGDALWFRVRVNTANGASPTVQNVQFGNLDVVDWLPEGTQTRTRPPCTSATSLPRTISSPDFHYNPPPVSFTSQYNEQPQAIASGSADGGSVVSGQRVRGRLVGGRVQGHGPERHRHRHDGEDLLRLR